MAIEFGKYHFKIVMNNMDDFEIHHDDGTLKTLTYIEMKDLTEVLKETAEHVRKEREKWSIENGKPLPQKQLWAQQKYMVEIKMNKEYSKEVINAVTSQEITDYERAIWNAAIEKCIEVANKYDSYGPAYEMRMLKK